RSSAIRTAATHPLSRVTTTRRVCTASPPSLPRREPSGRPGRLGMPVSRGQKRLRISRIFDTSVPFLPFTAARRIEHDLIVPPELLKEGPCQVERRYSV